MKQLSIIPLSLVLLAMLSLNFQGTAFAASLKGSPSGKHVTTMAPNCPSVVIKSKITPDCTPYPRCTATGCYNLDPYAEGCGTATTYNHISYVQTPIDDHIHVYGYLTNYYSSWCVANWAVVSLTQTGYNSSVTTRLSIFTYEGPITQGTHEEMCYPVTCYPFSYYTGAAYPTWTNMIDGRSTTYAYVYVAIGGKEFYIYPLEADQ